MFGMEKDKSKGEGEFIFDLEREVKDVDRYQDIVDTIIGRTTFIKELLRKGKRKEDYAQLAVILQAYVSVLKVLSRVVDK